MASFGHRRSRSLANRVCFANAVATQTCGRLAEHLVCCSGHQTRSGDPDVRSTLAEHLVMLGAPNAVPAHQWWQPRLPLRRLQPPRVAH